MFEETDKFDDWLRYFDEIKNTVIAIGAGIAGWFVVSGIENFIDKLGIANDKATSVFRNIKKLFAGGVLLSVGISLSSIAGKDVAMQHPGFTILCPGYFKPVGAQLRFLYGMQQPGPAECRT